MNADLESCLSHGWDQAGPFELFSPGVLGWRARTRDGWAAGKMSGQLARLCPKVWGKRNVQELTFDMGWSFGCAVREMGLWLQFLLIILTGLFGKSLANGAILTSPSKSWAGCRGPALSCWLTKSSACIPIQVYSPSFLLENILYHSQRISRLSLLQVSPSETIWVVLWVKIITRENF